MDRYVQARRDAVDCVTSLHRAMQDAGGSLSSTTELEKMSVMDFITQIAAQNGIRFVYVRPEKNE